MSTNKNTLRIGIVGPEEAKLGDSELLAIQAVQLIMAYAKAGRLMKSTRLEGRVVLLAEEIEVTAEPESVTLVSGRCPVSLCEACGKRSFLPSDFPIESDRQAKCEFCGAERKRRAGGIDIYAEAYAARYGYRPEIFPPEINEWADRDGKEGFRSRNIKIAKAADVIWVVAPRSDTECKHCRSKRPPHVSNGGCWTGVYAEDVLKKRVIWIIV